jgi:hypothetical protein
VVLPPALLSAEALAQAGEFHFLRDRAIVEEVSWSSPLAAARAADFADAPQEVLTFLSELDDVASTSREVSLAELVPRSTPGESFLRASLLPIIGGRTGGEGIAGRLGSLPLEVALLGNGWPAALASGPLRRITPGAVRPERQGHERS